MSKAYREKFNTEIEPITPPELRDYSKRPGQKDAEGNIQYFTEQSHKDQCNINSIVAKYDKTGVLVHINQFEAQFGDMAGEDYKTMLDTILDAKRNFSKLPSHIRKRFQNNPEKLLAFMEDPKNRDEAVKLGLINKMWTEETDGLGEHIKEKSQRKIKKDEAGEAKKAAEKAAEAAAE